MKRVKKGMVVQDADRTWVGIVTLVDKMGAHVKRVDDHGGDGHDGLWLCEKRSDGHFGENEDLGLLRRGRTPKLMTEIGGYSVLVYPSHVRFGCQKIPRKSVARIVRAMFGKAVK